MSDPTTPDVRLREALVRDAKASVWEEICRMVETTPACRDTESLIYERACREVQQAHAALAGGERVLVDTKLVVVPLHCASDEAISEPHAGLPLDLSNIDGVKIGDTVRVIVRKEPHV